MMAFADGLGIPYYARGPRIIHVPQPGDDLRDSRSSLDSVTPEENDDDVVSALPPPRRAAKPVAKPHKVVAKIGPSAPTRRKPFSVSLPEPPPPPPEPTGPRRALLSAPPPPPTSSIHDGPTPIRPTPRFSQSLPPPVSPPHDVTTMPAAENAAVAVDTTDDHLPPPGDPRLAPPEPGN